MINKKTATAVGVGAVAGALGISLAGGAFTASASPASTAAAHKSPAKHRVHPGARFGGPAGLRGLIHGTGVVKTKTGFETLAVDRGSVTAVSPTTVTIKSADGTSETFTSVPASKFRVDGKKSTIAGVKVGATASTVAVVQGGASDIKVLVVRPVKAATSGTTGTGA